jgi:hypothetical protein
MCRNKILIAGLHAGNTDPNGLLGNDACLGHVSLMKVVENEETTFLRRGYIDASLFG